MAASARCSSCGAGIVWVLTEASKAMPLDPDPHPDGNVEMTGRWATSQQGQRCPVVRVVGAAVLQLDLGDAPVERYMTHFATCPNANRHRRRVDPSEVGGARAQANHPETAHAAARLVKRGSQHAAVLLDLRDAPRGRTAYELATLDTRLHRARPGIPPNQAASRLGELRERDLVEVLVDRGMTVRRRAAAGDADVYVLTAKGKAEAVRLAIAEGET